MELIDVINIEVFPWGIHGGHLSPSWSNNTYMDSLAARDFIDPPTGEALRDVLIGKNGKIPEEGAPAQILRWKP
jgi:hypothetical protein